jgi:predicted Zn finger-like uncharacterized protein
VRSSYHVGLTARRSSFRTQMPEVVHCPRCTRKLRISDDLLGTSVKCPTCGETFTATLSAAADVGTVGAPSPLAELRQDVSPGLQPPIRPKSDYKPHRGVLILVLSILGIVACPIFSPFAWMMGNTDMKEIGAGRMDPEGKSMTNIGRIIGIVGTCLMVVTCVIYTCLGVAIFGLYQAGGFTPPTTIRDGAGRRAHHEAAFAVGFNATNV